MESVTSAEWMALISFVFSMATSVLMIIAFVRSGKKDTKFDAERLTKMQSDIEHILLDVVEMKSVPGRMAVIETSAVYWQMQREEMQKQIDELRKESS